MMHYKKNIAAQGIKKLMKPLRVSVMSMTSKSQKQKDVFHEHVIINYFNSSVLLQITVM